MSGANWLFLHHWVHQPFGDQYQPGMGMGWWGTHFGRNQTWIAPGRAFFDYLTRCQMLLRQGKFVSTRKNVLHRSSLEAEIYFITNPYKTVLNETFPFAVKNRILNLESRQRMYSNDTNGKKKTIHFCKSNPNPDESPPIFPAKK